MLPQWAVVILATVAMATPLAMPSAVESRKRNVPETHVLHERHQPSLQSKWVKRAKIDKDMVLPVRIGLRQNNLEEGHSRLMDMCVVNSRPPHLATHESQNHVRVSKGAVADNGIAPTLAPQSMDTI